MKIRKISFNNWQIMKSGLINVGFLPLALVKSEAVDIDNNHYGFFGGIKESFRLVSIDKQFVICEQKLSQEIKRVSEFNDYFVENYGNKRRTELLQSGEYKKLELQIGELDNVTIENDGKKYNLHKLNKSGTKWQIIAGDDIYNFNGLNPHGGKLHGKYVVVYDDIDNYTEAQKLILKKEKENLGGSAIIIIE